MATFPWLTAIGQIPSGFSRQFAVSHGAGFMWLQSYFPTCMEAGCCCSLSRGTVTGVNRTFDLEMHFAAVVQCCLQIIQTWENFRKAAQWCPQKKKVPGHFMFSLGKLSQAAWWK